MDILQQKDVTMQSSTEKLGAPLPVCPAASAQRGLFRKSTTYLAKIALVLQDAPDKMLTFAQLMEKLRPLMCENRRSVENNVRVCLSTNSCFVKIPVDPDLLDTKRNYWKLDLSCVSAKMVRRHFKGILQLFPELTPSRRKSDPGIPSEPRPAPPRPAKPEACGAVQIRCEVKFSGPFSIESLLKRDAPSPAASAASPLSSLPLRVEQQPAAGAKRSLGRDPEQLLLLAPSGCSTGGSTHHGLAARAVKGTSPLYTRVNAAVYFSGAHSGYITYSVPTFTQDAHCLRL